MVTNGIFTEEIELDDVFFAVLFLVQRDVLYSEGAATDLMDKGTYKDENALRMSMRTC